jgi:hypothetical protein
MQIAGFHRIISPAEFEVSFSSGGKIDSSIETPCKSFQILCQEKNKDPICGSYRIGGLITGVEWKYPAILHLFNCHALHIIAIHETTMI